MKFNLLLFLLAFGWCTAQMPNVEKIWLNDNRAYTGTIAIGQPMEVKINTSEQNVRDEQQYFVSGFSTVNSANLAKFEGKLNITKFRNTARSGTVYGTYELAEEPKGAHSGIFKGKFIYTFRWNRKTETSDRQYLEFFGTWASYDGALQYRTNWKNTQAERRK